jgi:cytochrome c peroxidase
MQPTPHSSLPLRPRFTDSGAGNPTLDLAGPVLLHDVGTCDPSNVAHPDRDGHPRDACKLDTPSLTGVASSPPYFHDGRAATLRDVLEMTRGTMGHVEALSSGDLDALVEYMRSL